MRCTNCNDTPCQEKDCSCGLYLNSDCINNVKAVFNCLNIETGLDLTQTLEAMDEALCERFESITNYFTLINTGIGAEVYKGVNLLGQKEIRKINTVGDLITVTQNTLDISISIDEDELTTFIQDNQLTVVIQNVGDGADILKTPATAGNETTYSLKSLKSENLGNGEAVFEGLQENTNDINFRFKSLKSNTLTISSDEEHVYIEQPENRPKCLFCSFFVQFGNDGVFKNISQKIMVIQLIFSGKTKQKTQDSGVKKVDLR